MKIDFSNGAFQLRGAKAEKRKRERARQEQEARDKGQEPLTPGQAARLSELLASSTAQTVTLASRYAFTMRENKEVLETCYAIGIDAQTLNDEQRRVILSWGGKAMTRQQRIAEIEDAA